MAYLTDARIFEDFLPADWKPLLDLLHELDLVAHAPESASLSAKSDQANRIEAKLLLQAGKLDEDLPPALDESSSEYKQWFTEAVLLWPHFAQVGSPVLVDTLGSTTLEKYDIDLPHDSLHEDTIRGALVRMFGWTADELQEIESKVTRLTRNLRIKRAVARLLSKSFDGKTGSELQAKSVGLMRELYGPLPWRPGDVEVVISAASIFLCLRYEGTSLTCPDYPDRPREDRDRISAFLKRLHTEQNSLKSVRFPSFGFFDPDLVGAGLIENMTERLRSEFSFESIGNTEVNAALFTMVNVLPVSEVDKYLVHDVWGHGWQEALCEFEWTFAQMPTIVEPLDSGILAGALEKRLDRSVLQPDVLLRQMETDLRRRIVIGLNLVVSEFLADLVEYKFSQHLSRLPTSSILPDGPLRLDLSLNDVRQMIHAWRRPYRHIAQNAAERERLRDQLRAAGLPEAGLMDAIEQASSLIQEHFGCAFDDSSDVSIHDSDRATANLLQRMMLTLVSIDAAFDQFCTQGEKRYQELLLSNSAARRWHCPAACIDLLALLVGWFYEQSRELHIWHLDEFVRRELLPTLLRLEGELRSGT